MCIVLLFLEMRCKWSHTICNLGVWLLSFSTVFLRLIRVVACISNPFFFIVEWYSTLWVYYILKKYILQSIDIWIVSTFWLLWTKLPRNIYYNSLCGHLPPEKWKHHLVWNCQVMWWETSKLFSKMALPLYFPTSEGCDVRALVSLYPCRHFRYFTECLGYFVLDLISIILMTNV